MDYRQELGIYEFTAETKYWPNWAKHGCLDLIYSQCHYFVVLDIHDEYCEGYMFSTKHYPNNVAMRSSDFKLGGFPIRKDTTTYFLTVPLKKFHYLQTKPEPVGWLTLDGKKHILSHAKGPAQTWDDYIINFCKDK